MSDEYLTPAAAEAARRTGAIFAALKRLGDVGGKTDGGFLRAEKVWKRIDRSDLMNAVEHACREVERPNIEQVAQLWAARRARRPRRLTLQERMRAAARARAAESKRMIDAAPPSDPDRLRRWCQEEHARLQGRPL